MCPEAGTAYQIKRILEWLQSDYPDINANTLRYWETEGVKSPVKRSKAGYRLYSFEDVDEFRCIKELSLDGMSLEQIRKEMDHWRWRAEKLGESKVDMVREVSRIRAYRILRNRIEEINAITPEEQMKAIYSRETLLEITESDEYSDYGAAESALPDLENSDLVGESGRYSRNDEIMLRLVMLDPHLLYVVDYAKLIEAFMRSVKAGFLPTKDIHDSSYCSREFFNACKRRADYARVHREEAMRTSPEDSLPYTPEDKDDEYMLKLLKIAAKDGLSQTFSLLDSLLAIKKEGRRKR